MKKNRIILAMAMCAIILSAAACYFIYTLLAPSRVTVYVFNDNYNAGEQLTSSMLTPIQVDATIITAGKSSDTGSQFVTERNASIINSGDSLRMNVSEGMPLVEAMLSAAGGSILEMNMQTDAIAVTIKADDITAVTNELKEGSRVNIYSCLDGTITLIQQNKRVLEVFKTDNSIEGVSIEEDVDGSMELIYATTYGSIYLGLVDASGYQSVDDDKYYPESIEQISDLYGMTDEEYAAYIASFIENQNGEEVNSSMADEENTDPLDDEDDLFGPGADDGTSVIMP